MNHAHRLTISFLSAALLHALAFPLHAQTTPADLAFRSAVDQPPPGWTGPVFKLSDDYPQTSPGCPSPWLKRQVNFKIAKWD